MRYGFCKEFSTPLKTEVDYELLKMIKEAGFDFVEMRAMLVAGLSKEEFEKLAVTLEELQLSCDCCCALFPKTVRVTGKDRNKQIIVEYMEKTFARLHRLGAKTVVFGSAPARALDENTSQKEGYAQLAEICREIIVPACEKYDITVVMEPLRASACNFINTLRDGMEVVNAVQSPRIKLLADTIHMMSNEDDPEDILRYQDSLKHIHIAELERRMPEDDYSPYVQQVLANLKQIGYNGTVSFESKNGTGIESMKKALQMLKQTLEM